MMMMDGKGRLGMQVKDCGIGGRYLAMVSLSWGTGSV